MRNFSISRKLITNTFRLHRTTCNATATGVVVETDWQTRERERERGVEVEDCT